MNNGVSCCILNSGAGSFAFLQYAVSNVLKQFTIQTNSLWFYLSKNVLSVFTTPIFMFFGKCLWFSAIVRFNGFVTEHHPDRLNFIQCPSVLSLKHQFYRHSISRRHFFQSKIVYIYKLSHIYLIQQHQVSLNIHQIMHCYETTPVLKTCKTDRSTVSSSQSPG